MSTRNDDAGLGISLVRNDLAFRAQRAIGLIPAGGLGIGRRAVALALLTWLPLAIWALVEGHALSGAGVGEPLFQHFGVTIRCLVAIPLLVLAEGVAHGVGMRLVPYFVRSGLVPEAERDRFAQIVHGIARLRDRTWPWVAIVAIVLARAALGSVGADAHELVWAEVGDARSHLGFGGIWFLYVVRPVFLILMLGWLWRVVLLFLLMQRIAKLDLALVPTHPDRAGGLGFLESLPAMFSLVALATSAVMASRWAHDVLYHGESVASLRIPAAVLLVLLLVLFLAPLLPFAGRLRAAKRAAVLDYGALVGRHGRSVRRKWILGEPGDDELLSAPEVGPVADTIALYEAVSKMRGLPIGRSSLLAIALPVALPILVVFAIQVPIKDILLKLVKTLV